MKELFTLVCFPLCKPRVFSAASPPLWRAVSRCSDLKASKGEEELRLSGTVSAPGPAPGPALHIPEDENPRVACVNF